MQKVEKALAVGPEKGTPPTLEWIAVDRLQVDAAYQRATSGDKSRRIILDMVRCWDWALCQPLIVSRRTDGSLFIIDGQHRHAGATARGDIKHLPCVVLAGCSTVEEARTFVALNTKRQRLSQADIFNGMLAAGDEDAKRVASIIEETGWRIQRHSNTAFYAPGELSCAPALVKDIRAHGEVVVRNALTTLREAYPKTPVRNSATLLKALIAIYRDGDLDGEDPDLFIEALSQVESPSDWEDCGIDVRRKWPTLSRIESISRAMLDTYREHAKGAAA